MQHSRACFRTRELEAALGQRIKVALGSTGQAEEDGIREVMLEVEHGDRKVEIHTVKDLRRHRSRVVGTAVLPVVILPPAAPPVDGEGKSLVE